MPKVKFTARLPDHVHKWLEKSAGRNVRSANSELIAILQAAMATEKTADKAKLREGAR